MADKNRLGKGLGAIFGEDVSTVLDDIQTGKVEGIEEKTLIPIKSIRTNPYQPRRYFDEEKLKELSESIITHGLFTPILVRKASKGYELVAGERRMRASKLAGVKEIEAILVEFDDEQMMEIALIENIQREDLNVMEEAAAYKLLMDRLELTQEEVAARVSKSRSHVANISRLLRLPASVQTMVQENKLSMGHVRPLLTLEDSKEIEAIAKHIYSKKLSVRDTEKYIKKLQQAPNEVVIAQDPYKYNYAIQLFEDKLQTRVKIDSKNITISITDDDDLNRILETLDLIEK